MDSRPRPQTAALWSWACPRQTRRWGSLAAVPEGAVRGSCRLLELLRHAALQGMTAQIGEIRFEERHRPAVSGTGWTCIWTGRMISPTA